MFDRRDNNNNSNNKNRCQYRPSTRCIDFIFKSPTNYFFSAEHGREPLAFIGAYGSSTKKSIPTLAAANVFKCPPLSSQLRLLLLLSCCCYCCRCCCCWCCYCCRWCCCRCCCKICHYYHRQIFFDQRGNAKQFLFWPGTFPPLWPPYLLHLTMVNDFQLRQGPPDCRTANCRPPAASPAAHRVLPFKQPAFRGDLCFVSFLTFFFTKTRPDTKKSFSVTTFRWIKMHKNQLLLFWKDFFKNNRTTRKLFFLIASNEKFNNFCSRHFLLLCRIF